MSHPVRLPHAPVTSGDRAALEFLYGRLKEEEPPRDRDHDAHRPTLGELQTRYPTL